jgi:hypothetical protein
MTTILLAVLIGAAFGAVLDRVGASNPNTIGAMLSLRDLSLAKAILLAIGLGSVLMFAGQMAGIVDVGHMSVKTTYAGVFIGGLILGAGWALAGYCPGTGVVAAAAGRIDALVFIVGGLAGAGAYMATYAWWADTGLLAGDKLTLGTVPGSGVDGLLSLPGDVVGLAMGAIFIAAAFVLPDRLAGGSARVAPAE